MADDFLIEGVWNAGDEKPDWKLLWVDGDGRLIDFSTGYTWQVRVSDPTETTAAFATKTTGITGAVGSLTTVPPTPNVVVAWNAGDLGSLVAGKYKVQIIATASGARRSRKGTIVIGTTLP